MAALTSSSSRSPSGTFPAVTLANPASARPTISRSVEAMACATAIAESACSSARSGSPSSSRANAPSRSARRACSGARGKSVEEPARAMQPSVRHGELPPKRGVIPGEPHGEPRRRRPLVPFAVERVAALPGLEDAVASVEPPRRESQPLERFRALLALELAFEGRSRLLPRSPRERVAGELEPGHRTHRVCRCLLNSREP